MPVPRRSLFAGLAVLLAAGGSAPPWAAPGRGGAAASGPASGDAAVIASARPLDALAALPEAESARAAAGGAAGPAWFAELPVGQDVAVAAATWPLEAEAPALAWREVVAGVPGPWRALPPSEESDEPSAAAGSAPAIVLGAERVQVAGFGPGARAATLRLYESGGAGAPREAEDVASEVGLLASNPAADKARPAIRSRAAWGAAPRRGTASYGRVQGVLVHHTDTTNRYSAAQVPAMLRAVQAFHMQGRGWQDIAYNVVVDRFGVAWEGRAGGLTAGVVGAHSYGETNEVSFGLVLLGDFDVAPPPAGMLATAEHVIAWKFLLHGVDPTSTFVGTSGRLKAISEHRDDRPTSCPGRYVSARMSSVRSGVIARMGAARRTAAPRLPVTGVLDQATVKAMQAWLGVRADGAWGPVTTRVLQARVGARVTGVRDAQTTRRVQALVGVRADGVWGRATTSALQRYLNAR